MPLFFFLSGYVFSTKYDFKTFLKRKCKTIIIPYFSLGIVVIVFEMLFNYPSGAWTYHTFLLLLRRLIVQRRFSTLWYMACLFWVNIVFYGLVKKFHTLKSLFFVVMGMLIGGLLYYHFGGAALPWNIDVIWTSSIFFFGGYWFKSYYPQICERLSRNKSILLFFIMLIINVCFGYFGIKISGKGLEMFGSSYGFPPLTLLSAFAGITCVVIFSHWFNLRGVKYIGKNSMIYYAWHQSVLIPMVRLDLEYIGISSSIISNNFALLGERILELMIIVALSTVYHICISKTKLKFMIGR